MTCSTITWGCNFQVSAYFWPYSGSILSFLLYGRKITVHFELKFDEVFADTNLFFSLKLLLIFYVFSFTFPSGVRDVWCTSPPHHSLFLPPWAELPLAAARIADRFPPWWVLARVWLQSPAKLDRPNQTPLVKIKKKNVLSGSVRSGAVWRVEASSFEPVLTAGRFERPSGQLHGGPAGCRTGVGVI